MSVKIKIAKSREAALNDEEVMKELQGVQEFFDTADFKYEANTINFVLLKGFYYHLKRATCIVGVFVNKTGISINEIKGTLNFKFRNLNAQIMNVDLNFPEEFMGCINDNEGLLVHMNIPTAGLNKDEVFDIRDLSGELSNVKIKKVVDK